ncbi:predicted protein [Arabidopsis lyrata subsp. lyrata]|uniref:Predicted protein n=1 Tax=Arabidopsis lyrata subsp. lyrata TaxID=81972 RepID=D7LS06_ARALL|nr:predicted protein [Arabidopsis lyrata subsp. lyrata]
MLLVVSAIRLAHGYLWRRASLDENCGSSRRGCLALSVASFSSESCCWVSEICGSGGCSVHRRMGEILGSWWILSFGGLRINGRGLVSSLVGFVMVCEALFDGDGYVRGFEIGSLFYLSFESSCWLVVAVFSWFVLGVFALNLGFLAFSDWLVRSVGSCICVFGRVGFLLSSLSVCYWFVFGVRSVTFFQISRTISNPSYLGGYASISDSGQRWCPANFLPHPLLVASWPERTAHALSNSPEDSLHRASLMAGDISLGPSVAPCPVKTSTAHDDPLAWETVFLTGKANPLLFSASALDHAHRLQTPYLPPPESLASSHFSPSSPYSRRLLNLNWLTEEKLGFSLVGSASKSGPLTSPKPKSVCYGPPPSFNKPRSVSEFYLSISSQLLCRFSNLNGQGLHLRCKSPSMLWIYEFFLRTLLLDSPIAMIYDSFCLKYYGRLFPIPIRHGVIIVTKALCPNTTFRQIYLPSSSTI